MLFTNAEEKITATTPQKKWAGEVVFPFVDRSARRVVVERVFVVPEFRGQGLAAQLMAHFVTYANQQHLTVKLMCPYAKQYFRQHPQVQSLLLPQDRFQSKGDYDNEPK